jgi:lysophospholipase L1-like esterase
VLGNVLLAVASLVVFCGAAELCVRLLKPDLSLPQAEHSFRFSQAFEFALPHHQRDPVLGWRLTPGTYGQMHVNQHGFRGREFASASQDVRIAHLGDSCTMGFGIPSDADIYASRLESQLRGAGFACETLNFGVDGYSSHQGRLLVPSVLEQFAPRYVTVYFGYNDHHLSNTSDAQSGFWGSKSWRSTLDKSHAYRWLRRTVLVAMGRRAELRSPKRRVDVETFAENLSTIVRQTRAAGATPILMTTPLRPDVPLIENEVKASIDGRETWVTQSWWMTQHLKKHNLALPGDSGTPELRQALEGAVHEHPDWPYPYWLLARELAAAGDVEAARQAMSRAREHDAERNVMHEYNDCVRRVAATEDCALLDLAQEFEGAGSPFLDVVHPDPAGHQRIAARLAETILRLESSTAARPIGDNATVRSDTLAP